ncbi:PhnD/SsuA/transferrin family substrate-binding protein [Candidatus Bipolaricaulota bacterium]|nr:PhnD/SsuA/transferrin family substrate-binding protein [Candidatus Bipolaricaulota bacterium]
MRRTLAVTLIALVVIGLIGFAQVGTRTNPIKMVLVPSTSGEDILEIGQDIAEALSGLTGYYIEAILQPDYAAMVETFATSDGDVFGMPASVQYLSIFERTGGKVTPRLASVRYGATTYQAGLYVRRDSGINSVLDCNGKVWLATDELSTSGNVIPSIVFENWGIVPSEKIFTGSHPAAMTALVEGQGDFATCFYSPPGAPAGFGDSWELGDDLERWLWDPYNNAPYSEAERGSLRDVRGGIDDIYSFESLIWNFKCVALIGGNIPNDCVAFGPNFDTTMADAIVQAIKDHIATDAGLALWNSDKFYEWTAVADITDAYYDGLRTAIGMPIPVR